MKLNRSNLIMASLTLVLGLVLGAAFFGGDSDKGSNQDHNHELASDGTWTCSMHPQVKQSEPGSCPFCGMDLIPASNEEEENPTVLRMSNNAMQLANIQTVVITNETAANEIRLQGRVRVDERRVNIQTTHFEGRVEKLYKNFEGDMVKVGDKVASIYSPELVTAQEELIEAKKLEKSNPVLLEAARKKLRHWKLSSEQISQIETSEVPMRDFDLLSDYDGTITKKMVNTGNHLHEGGSLLEITDLTKVWVVFEVYEKDLNKVRIGDRIDFQTKSDKENYQGIVSFISPDVDPETRVIEVRADVESNDALKPQMFVEAVLSNVKREALMIPKTAVLWTGKRSIVYVKVPGESSFELREVILGESLNDNYVIESGLEEGEEVVVNGVFTLDAEAQLRGKTSMMNTSTIASDNQANEVSAKLPEVAFKEVQLPTPVDYKEQIDSEFKNQLSKLSINYLSLKDAMVEGNGGVIRKEGLKLKSVLDKVDMKLLKGEAHLYWMEMLKPMEVSLKIINSTADRDTQRLQFINLSKALITSIESFGTSSEGRLYVQFCPMANNNKGAIWISDEEEVINPYFGDAMLNCGSVQSIIEESKK